METNAKSALEAIKVKLGGNVGVARALGNLTSQAVSQWVEVPYKRALELEEKAGIPRHVSRPDIFAPAALERKAS